MWRRGVGLPGASAPGLRGPSIFHCRHRSIRRGFQVYKRVCSSCHSMGYVAYRHQVGVCFTEDVEDGPNEDGEMFMRRPGKLSTFQNHPPTLSLQELLTMELYPLISATAFELGMVVRTMYFPCSLATVSPPLGCHCEKASISTLTFLARPLAWLLPSTQKSWSNDGTPATMSQVATDIATFLRWASEPEHDHQKRVGLKMLLMMGLLLPLTYAMKRHKWSVLKSPKLAYRPPK